MKNGLSVIYSLCSMQGKILYNIKPLTHYKFEFAWSKGRPCTSFSFENLNKSHLKCMALGLKRAAICSVLHVILRYV